MWRTKKDTTGNAEPKLEAEPKPEAELNLKASSAVSNPDTVSSLGFQEDLNSGNKNSGIRNAHLHRIEMKGRQKESTILRKAYERVADQNAGESEMIVVVGSSGSGKTTLAESLRKPVSLEGRGYYVCGKFDQLFANDRPYSAIVDAFTDIIDLIMLSNDLESRKESIKKALGSEVTLMCNLLSNLHYLTGTPLHYDGDDFANNMRHAFLRFKLLCRKFIRALATQEHPIVIVFDDVQWSDQASLDVIKYLATDSESRHVLLIASLRSDSVNMVEELLTVKNQQQQQQHRGSDSSHPINIMRTTLVEICNLDIRGLNDLVAAVLAEDSGKTMELSEVVMKRTAGSPYFTLQFLENLETECLLTYDLQSERWLWNTEKILESTTLSDNILQIVAAKIDRLGIPVQRVLHIASCLSYQCDLATLEKAVNEVQSQHHLNIGRALMLSVGEDFCHSNFQEIISFACEEDIIEMPTKTEYKFTHDRVREILYYMIGNDVERQTLHLVIGRLLRNTTIKKAHYPLTLISVEQLNRGATLIEDSAEVLHLVQLNREVGKLAAKKGLFVSSAQYLRQGLSLLDPTTRWGSFYDLTLEMSTSLCELEASAGLYNESKVTANDIIVNAVCPDDKLRAYNALIDSLYMDDDLRQAYDLCRALLPGLGVKLPQKADFRHVAIDFVKTKLATRNLNHQRDIGSIPDRKTISTMKMLASMASCSVLLQENEFLALSLFAMMKITSSKGITEYSPLAFAGYGIFLATTLGYRDEAFSLGEEAVRLVGDLQAKEIGGRAMTIASQYCLHWKRPIEYEVELNMEAYIFAMDTGDVDSAHIAAQAYITCCFYAGDSLAKCEQEGARLIQQMVEFNQKTWYSITVPYVQMFLNFMGHSDDALILTGDVMNQAEMEIAMTENDNVVGIRTIWLAQLYLATFLQDFCLGLEIVKILEVEAEQSAGHLNFYEYKFAAALTYQGAYQLERNGSSSKRRKYKYAAKKIIKRFEKFVKNGCVNVVPLLAILKAEQLSCVSGNCSQHYMNGVRTAYDNAICKARAADLVHYEALATEKAGLVLLEMQAFDPEEAVTYLSRAIELYSNWGAGEKSGRLEDTREDLVTHYKLDLQTARKVPSTLFAEF